MNPWILILLIGAAAVFAIDYAVRRKKWKDNTKTEKISLLLNMFSVGIYIFSSILGLLWGITGSGANTALGEAIYNVTLALAGIIWIVSTIATIGSFILRKKGKVKASIWINSFSLVYILLVFLVSYMAGELL